MTTTQQQSGSRGTSKVGCCGPNALWGWSPPALPADTVWKTRVDRFLPRTGLAVLFYFAGVIMLLNVGRWLPERWDLITVAVAAGGGGGWCAVNFWRCRHAHCLITGAGWLGLAAFTLVEAGLGRSVIAGDEGLVFVAVAAAGLLFECGWQSVRGSNALTRRA